MSDLFVGWLMRVCAVELLFLLGSLLCAPVAAQAEDVEAQPGTEQQPESAAKSEPTAAETRTKAPPPKTRTSRTQGWAAGQPLPGPTPESGPPCDTYGQLSFYLGDTRELRLDYNEYVERHGSGDGFADALHARYGRKKGGGVALMVPGVLLMLGAAVLGGIAGATGEYLFFGIAAGAELLGAAFLVPGIVNLVKGTRLQNKVAAALRSPCVELPEPQE